MEMIKKPTSVLRPQTPLVIDLETLKASAPEETNTATYNENKSINEPVKGQLSAGSNIIVNLGAGSIAGALAKTTIAPLDRTKINFQIQNKKFTFFKAVEFMRTSCKTQGLLSLWRGNSATMARIVPYAAIQYAAHEHFKILLGTNQEHKSSNGRRYLAGALAGIVSTALTYPLDLARARMAVTHRETYNNLLDVFKLMIREEGVRSLYRGYTATLLGVIPYAGTSFYTYETLKKHHFAHVEGTREPNPLERLLFGATAGAIAQSASYPLDIVRRRIQTSPLTGTQYTSIAGTIVSIYRTEGIIGGLYKGLSLNWIKGPIAVGISFATFDISRKFIGSLFTDG